MRNLFVETANVKALAETAGALTNGDAGVPGLALVHGCRGLGKTRGAIWYAARNKCIYLRAKSVWSPSWMLEELCIALGLTPGKRKKDLFSGVEAALKQRPRLIFFDEMNMPPLEVVHCVRDLHDVTDNPIILLGHEEIVERLQRIGPFFDRFLYITEFKPLRAEDLQSFCASSLEMPIESEAIEEVVRQTNGNFRKSIVLLKGMENRARLNRAASIALNHLQLRGRAA